jgi:hypothetical protein
VFQELIMMSIAIKKPFSFNFFIQVPLPERPETEFFNFPSFENDL